MQPDRAHPSVQALDDWIRGPFVSLNAELEDVYAAQPNRVATNGVGDDLKARLVDEGRARIAAVLDAAVIAGSGFDHNVELMANVGFYMAACRRHDITEPSRERTSPLVEASAVALQLGAAIGMVPRFVVSHNQTHNRSVNGTYRTFTGRTAERVFIEYNSRSAFAFMRAAEALTQLQPLGVSHPLAPDLFSEAERALVEALALNTELSEVLDTDEFYYSVRPYFKPYRVGAQEYRGANAGDFAAFNQIDLVLGLCSPRDPSYLQVVTEKIPYLMPDEQRKLRATFERPSILDELLANVNSRAEPWFQRNVGAFLGVCDALGAVAAHHHDDLVAKFIEKPSATLAEEDLVGITASGPPLDVLLRSLEKLRDLRLAADRHDIPSRHDDLARLRALVSG